MGFGLLFIGYLFMFSFTPYGFDILPDIIGFGISYMGVKSLADYGCGWDILKKFYIVVFPAASVTFVFQVLCAFKQGLFDYTIWSYIYNAILLFYNVLLFVAIYKIADDVEMKSIKFKAQRNLIFGIVYYALVFLFDLPIGFIQRVVELLKTEYAAGMILYLCGYIWLFLNLAVIFSCYMWICAQGDEDMPMKERKKRLKNDEED